PTLPIALGSGQFTTFTAQYQPTGVGNHTGTINITDNLARLVHAVNLSGSCIDPTVNAIPYTQNFDGTAVPNLPFDWQKLTWGSGSVTTVTTSPFSAPNCVLMNNSNSSTGPYLIAPPVSSAYPVNTLRIRFRAKAASGFSLNVGVMSNPLDPATFTGGQIVMLSNSWTEYTVDLRNYQGTGAYIAFQHNQGGNNRSIYIDNVVIEALLQNDLASLQITGETTPNAGSTYNYSITVANRGLNTQTDYQVKLFKTGNIELASAEGPALTGNSQATVTIPWTPTTVESTQLYGKIVLTGDQNSGNDQTPSLQITVQESATTLVVIGSGNQYSNEVPVNMNAHSSLYENIYRQDEIIHAGLISIVNFYNFFTSNIPPKHTKIWLGMTDQTDLSGGWIPASQLSLVFDGEVNYPSGINTISIPLQVPYTLVQGYNLVMMVQRPLDPAVYSYWDNFACQTDTVNRARRASSTEELNPNNPPTGAFTGQFPKTGFFITPGGAGNLSGIVRNTENQPLANVTINLLNGPQTTTDASGQYSFINLFARDYTVNATALGFDDQTQYVTVLENNPNILDITMTPTPTIVVTGTLVGSDNPSLGLAGAQIVLSGYQGYQATTDAMGDFSVAGVFAGHTYEYVASAPGYQPRTGSLNIGTTDYDLGDIVLNEITSSPTNVSATPINNHTAVDIIWLAPGQEGTVRALLGYKVWRLEQGQEQDETAWTLLTPGTITLQRFADTGWSSLAQGFYKWAVKCVYTNDLLSSPAISNALETTGVLTGIVRNAQMNPVSGATITAGTYTTITAADGSYTLHLPGGTYTVTCSMNGYYLLTQYNIQVVVGQTTQLDLMITTVGNDDDVQVAMTRLLGNYPNPFNPETVISFEIKDATDTHLDIYNLKGQLVRRLVNESKAPGSYSVVWDGKDDQGKEVGSGIYQYRLRAGKYQRTNRMTLRK
ncbi:MAG TPA: carboxypeptidase regulatory-like domain-containing protein, partial [Candidatus Cloacimonadota bacterium]|nr:carboxypeptidase regulatory-like domain-containing protein [Candidatus Cloacimonadota bacterium]